METKGFKSQFKHQIYTNLIQSCKGLCADCYGWWHLLLN